MAVRDRIPRRPGVRARGLAARCAALEESRSEGLAKLAVWGLAAGGATLGVAWIGVFQQRQCVAHGLRATRLFALLAFAGFIIEIVAHQKKLSLSDGTRSFVTMRSLGSLGATGIFAALGLLGLYGARTDEHQL